MRRINTATKAVDLFGVGKHGFKNGDPALAILATKLNAEFFNSIQEELANLIEASGQTLAGADNTQLLKALQILRETMLTKSVAGGVNVTLTDAESRHTVILLTGVLTANINVIVPATGRPWVIANNTTGAFTVTVKTAAGSGVAVTQATAAQLYCDGTNVLQPAVTIPDASTSVKGKVQLATAAEAQALTDALKALSPAGLAAAFGGANQSLGANGYQRIAGGLILQWGTTASLAVNSSTPITFPIAFPSVAAICLAGGTVSTVNGSAAQQTAMNVSALSVSGFTVSNDDGVMSARWFALGY